MQQEIHVETGAKRGGGAAPFGNDGCSRIVVVKPGSYLLPELDGLTPASVFFD
jgi:hypothetical protein